ncbi:sigma-54-dependent Fis family transcriptional regulator [bacterium]|nr:sigma-54-dependent Fis family transcriptional regulator [bacterium]
MTRKNLQILIAEDDAVARETLAEAFSDRGYKVLEARDGEEAETLAKSKSPDLMLTDWKMPKRDGMQLVEALSKELPIILMTAYGNVEYAVLAMEKGAFSFIEKPIDLVKLFALVDKALQHSLLQKENEQLKERLERTALRGIIGSSLAMQEVFSKIKQVAASDTTVCILGESGTGKELVANAIQSLSSRAQAPFIKLNCAAIPENLLESELFGHERGAFTGAEKQRIGKFEQADHGTLMLDEIAEMKPELQAKLLRVLQDGEFTRLGGTKTIKADVRIICATNADIEDRIAKGLFRSDLYYRISVFTINLPPLRERKDDIEHLAKYFLDQLSSSLNREFLGFSKEALKAMRGYSWPGNVRQLRNAVEYATITTGDKEEVSLASLPREISQTAGAFEEKKNDAATPPLSLKEMEKQAIQAALKRSGGKKDIAAKELGIGLKTIYRKIEEYDIK